MVDTNILLVDPDVSANAMARHDPSKPESEREGNTSVPFGSLERPVSEKLAPAAPTTNTREERREELKQLAARPNGVDRLYLILSKNSIPFPNLPIERLMIDTILDHEYQAGK